jgi:hypothetical protein
MGLGWSLHRLDSGTTNLHDKMPLKNLALISRESACFILTNILLIWSYALEEGKAHREMYSELKPNHPELVKG